MGMLFNNWWEAFCRTYLELNGYFVQSNLFIDASDYLVSHPHEADLVAYKIPGTAIKFASDMPRSMQGRDPRSFFAGGDQDPLVYCEIRANFTTTGPAQAIKKLVEGDDYAAVEMKFNLVKARFPGPDPAHPMMPTVVIMAAYLDESLKEMIATRDGWKHKTFDEMYEFMRGRFELYGPEKLRLTYNDPCLEMLRYLTIRDQRVPADVTSVPEAK